MPLLQRSGGRPGQAEHPRDEDTLRSCIRRGEQPCWNMPPMWSGKQKFLSLPPEQVWEWIPDCRTSAGIKGSGRHTLPMRDGDSPLSTAPTLSTLPMIHHLAGASTDTAPICIELSFHMTV